MPIYLRKFYFRELIELKEGEKKKIDEAQKKSKTKSPPRFKR